jgi:hypothetical protein
MTLFLILAIEFILVGAVGLAVGYLLGRYR